MNSSDRHPTSPDSTPGHGSSGPEPTPRYGPEDASNPGPEGTLNPGTGGPHFVPSGYGPPMADQQRFTPPTTYPGQPGYPSSLGQAAATYPGGRPVHSPSPSGGLTPGAAAPKTAAPKTAGVRRGFVAAVCAAALIGGGTGAGSFALLSQDSTAAPISVGTTNAPINAILDGTVTAAAKAISPSVVTISVTNGSSGGIGSGVIVDTTGHILTNQHVVGAGGQAKITVSFSDGSTAPATIAGQSAETDLAVLSVTPDAGVDLASLKPATFAESGKLEVGQSVVAVGAPLGLSKTVTSGVLSTLNRPVRSGLEGNAVYDAVQTDAPINPGNSGGPLVDLDGRVVGINSSIASTASQGQGQPGSIGIGFAIPSDLATMVAGQLIDHGTATLASLGVQIAQPSSQAEASLTGVRVADVEAGGAASKAGLRAGDVITKIDELQMSEVDGVIAAVRSYPVGAEISVSFTRDGQARQAAATLGARD